MVCNQFGAYYSKKSDPICLGMFASYIWNPYNRCDIDFNLNPSDNNVTNVVSLAKSQFAVIKKGKVQVNCKYNVINGVISGEGSISNKLFVINATIDATGCDTIEVAPFDFVSGPLTNVNISGTISITNSPSPQNSTLSLLANTLRDYYYCLNCYNDLKYYVSLTSAQNLATTTPA